MEVFMRGVPPDLTEKTLRAELLPFMNALGIQDWACDKVKKRDRAWVTFLKETDGQRFLKKHESKQDHRPTKSAFSAFGGNFNTFGKVHVVPGLILLKSHVYVHKSTRPVDKQYIDHIKHERETRATRKRDNISQRGSRAPTPSFETSAVACGDNVFINFNEMEPDSHKSSNATTNPDAKALCFAEQTRWSTTGKARFGQNSFVMTMEDLDGLEAFREFRLEIPYITIHSLIAGQQSKSFTFVLTEPPRLYQKLNPIDFTISQAYGSYTETPKWERSMSLKGPAQCGWAYHDVFAATCLVYAVSLSPSDAQGYTRTVDAVQSLDLLPLTRYNLPVYRKHQHPEADHLVQRDQFMATIGEFMHFETLPFPLLFQIQALVWNNYLRPASGTQMLAVLEHMFNDAREKGGCAHITTDAMKHLFQRIPYVSPGVDPTELDVKGLVASVIKTEFSLRTPGFPERDKLYGVQIPSNQSWVFKAMVTPTRVMLHGPEAESRNRVLRMFPDQTDHFLRVQFCDEDGTDLTFQPSVSNDEVYRRYRQVLRDGLDIAGRKFSFLGFSHSSLRSHSCWFSAPFYNESGKYQSYRTILKSLGDFQDIRIPAKCAARIGQAFSETPYAIPLAECGIRHRTIPDVKSSDGERVFSDGVGTVSHSALLAMYPYLSCPNKPTILQIRWGGFKGLLAYDPSLSGTVFCVRPESMMKFPSTDLEELGICDYASRTFRLMLNRQMIKILEDMGTSDQWFKDRQKEALDILRGVTSTATRTADFLEHQAIGSKMGFPRLIKQLDRLGINYRRDQFLKSVVEHTVLRELRALKHKARIPVEGGATLFGIMDETGFLEEGQVYVTFDATMVKAPRRRGRSYGQVIVTRSPALHPGDIQFAEMVIPPDGHPLCLHQNCIVFSQKGSRDLPSQLSGGDLDGDLYHVIWDPEAMPERSFAPADYPRVAAVPLDRPVRQEDMADFFTNFMKSDLLGVIATRHVMLADVYQEGTLHEECITLAGMHSTAVDFAKTGIPVDAKDMPRPKRFRPDFLAPAPPLKLYDRGQIDYVDTDGEADDAADDMGGSSFRYYKSEKILGWLYRNVDEKKIWAENIQKKVKMNGPTVWEQLLGLLGAELEDYGLDIDHTQCIEEAWKIRNLYESSVYDNMWHFSDNPRAPLTEVEAFCGFILNRKGRQTRRQRDSSVKLKEEMDRIMTWIVKLIRDRKASDVDDVASSTATATDAGYWGEAVVELCWACLVVACSPKEDTLFQGDGELQSFKVVAACCLMKELNNLSMETDGQVSGGFVGVGSGGGRDMVLPIRDGRRRLRN